MQHPPMPPDAPEPSASLQFQQRIMLTAIPVVVCVALVTGIVINILRIVAVVPEVHATLAAGTSATVKATNGEMVAVTINQINPINPSPFIYPPLRLGNSPYAIMTSIQDARASDSVSFAWTAIGSDGKTYRGPVIGFSKVVFAFQGKTPVPMIKPTMPFVHPMFVDFQLPSGVTVRSVVCSLPSPQFDGFVQATAGRLYFDAP